MKLSHAVLVAGLGLAAGQAMACYTVYDSSDRIVYNDLTPPVDMSQPLHEALSRRFPNSSMVFNDSRDCPSEARLSITSKSGKSPLLTDSKTAESLGLPHKRLGNGLAVISERPDDMRAGVTLAESGLPRDDTRAMGAGPAPQGPANRPAARPLFITPNGAPPPGITRSSR
ncbi:MAG: hypothetical protein ACXWC6_12970 [Ramlibacter sp.]